MSRDISELLNLHKDKTCHLVGHGPSLDKYLDELQNLDKSSNIIFSVNDVDKFTNLVPDYWLTSNPGYTVDVLSSRINKFKDTTFLYSDCYDLTNEEVVKSLLNVKFYSYDSVHFNSESNIFSVKGWRLGCKRGWIDCCSNIIKDRLTLQEYLQKLSGYINHYSTGDTGILHALAFSIILGCRNIKIYGVDLDYSVGYTNGIPSMHGDSFDYWMDRIKSDFFIINESAKMMGIKLTFLGGSSTISSIINSNMIPEKVYQSDTKEYN
jgi:hypothetical protein